MITLTTPAQINSVLGGNAPISYNKLVISPFRFDPINKRVDASVQVLSTANPEMQNLDGNLSIDYNTGVLIVSVAQIDFYRRVVLTAGQMAAINTVVQNAQNALESGLVTLGVIAGTQSTGV